MDPVRRGKFGLIVEGGSLNAVGRRSRINGD